ncbi:MAG TPA: hypothetical protein VFX84_03575 [Candidatus Saccharimonadales bacterium]|nr:hypothetical protein [Candidatus Saccharimonadales bacterium]
MDRSKIVLRFATALLAAVLLFSLAYAPKAGATYNSSNLISDGVFTNYNSMSAGAIQNFLASKGSYLAGYKVTENCGSTSGSHYSFYASYYTCGAKVYASRAIYDAARAYKISPRTILATLQKEQSLITDPSPSSSQLNCAMGYRSCESGYLGFFRQVDDGTWQFRTYLELMNGRNYWGYGPSSYPCKNASSLYSTGLYPGRTVTFYNPGGVAKTITLANSATAGLYCYTPHVGPYSETGYSGSYNFVTSWEAWWGSTTYTYASYITSVQYYSDPGRTNPISLSGPFSSGQTIYVTVTATNTGSKSWSSSFARVGTTVPDNRSSAFADGSWLSSARPSNLDQSSVAPNGTGTFKFSITTPNKDGTYKENFRLVAEGRKWMSDNSSFSFNMTVSNPYNGSLSVNAYRDSAHTQRIYPSYLVKGQKVYYRISAKNTGQNTWDKSFTKVATKNPNNRSSVFSDSSWYESNRPDQLNQSSVAPGQTGTFDFSLTAPQTTGTYNESFGLVAEGLDWMPSTVFTENFTVVSGPLSILHRNMSLYPGQQLVSSDGRYRLVLQGDGNLVLYSDRGRALWHTKTNGKGGYYLILQGDGNLVLYTKGGKPLWHTHTARKGGYFLNMQSDGNLVLYTSGSKPLWHTHTNGKY